MPRTHLYMYFWYAHFQGKVWPLNTQFCVIATICMHMFTIAYVIYTQVDCPRSPGSNNYIRVFHGSLCRTLDEHLSTSSLNNRAHSTVAAGDLSNLLIIVVDISSTSMLPFAGIVCCNVLNKPILPAN